MKEAEAQAILGEDTEKTASTASPMPPDDKASMVSAESSEEKGADADAIAKEALLSEHRAALSKMRASMALDMLIEASGARDADIIRTLLSVDIASLAETEDADGIPDTRAVKDKLAHLKRDCSYLFMRSDVAPDIGAGASGGAVTGIRIAGVPDTDDALLSDEDYYKKHYRR